MLIPEIVIHSLDWMKLPFMTQLVMLQF